MLLFCKAILKYLLYQLGTGGINEMKNEAEYDMKSYADRGGYPSKLKT